MDRPPAARSWGRGGPGGGGTTGPAALGFQREYRRVDICDGQLAVAVLAQPLEAAPYISRRTAAATSLSLPSHTPHDAFSCSCQDILSKLITPVLLCLFAAPTTSDRTRRLQRYRTHAHTHTSDCNGRSVSVRSGVLTEQGSGLPASARPRASAAKADRHDTCRAKRAKCGPMLLQHRTAGEFAGNTGEGRRVCFHW